MTDPGYPYADPDLHREPCAYMYTPYQGPDFLRAWRESREGLLRACGTGTGPLAGALEGQGAVPPCPAPVRTRDLLLDLLAAPGTPRGEAWLEALLRRFELTKRLGPAYVGALKPIQDADAPAGDLEALLALALMRAFASHGDLRWLNAALKVVDLAAARGLERMTPAGREALARAVLLERAAVQALGPEPEEGP